MPYEIRFTVSEAPEQRDLEELDGVQAVHRDEDGLWRLASSDAAKTVGALMSLGQNGELTHLEVAPANLEDVFLAITGRQLRD